MDDTANNRGLTIDLLILDGPEASDDPNTSQSTDPDYCADLFAAAGAFRHEMIALHGYIGAIHAAAINTQMVNLGELSEIIGDLRRTSPDGAAPIALLEIDAGEARKAQIPVRTVTDLRRCDELLRSSDRARTLLYKTSLQQAVSILERLIAEIAFYAILADPKNLVLEDKVAVSELLSLESFDDARRLLAYEQTVTLMHRPFFGQIEYLNKILNVNFQKLYRGTPFVAEAILRRHAAVHGTSFSQHLFEKRRSTIPNLPKAQQTEPPGSPGAAYLGDAWAHIYALGVIIVHAAASSAARSATDSIVKARRFEGAEQFLVEAAFAAIVEHRFAPARAILEYFLENCPQSRAHGMSVLMAKVNLAQSLKWDGKETECEQLLATLDLATLNSKFCACIAALRNDVDGFRRHLATAAAEGTLSLQDLCDWPVFNLVRRQNDFADWVAEAFDVPRERVKATPRTPAIRGPGTHNLASVFRHLDDLTAHAVSAAESTNGDGVVSEQ